MHVFDIDTIYDDEWIYKNYQKVVAEGIDNYGSTHKNEWGKDLYEALNYRTFTLQYLWEKNKEYEDVYKPTYDFMRESLMKVDLFEKPVSSFDDIETLNTMMAESVYFASNRIGRSQCKFYRCVPKYTDAETLTRKSEPVWWEPYEMMDTETRVIFLHMKRVQDRPCDIIQLKKRISKGHTLISLSNQIFELDKYSEEYKDYGKNY